MKYLLFVLTCFLLACANESGTTLNLGETRPVTYERVTAAAFRLDGSRKLTIGKGREFVLDLGFAGPGQPSLVVEGAMGPVPLTAGRWQRIRGTAQRSEIELVWQGGDLDLAPVYVAPRGGPHPVNLLLISIDTLRADYFDAEHMPQLYALFRKGLIFERVTTPAPWTLPAHLSLLTSSYPARHGVRQPNQTIPADLVTLAEVMTRAGYYASALTEGNYVSAAYGFQRGHHRFGENPPSILATDPGAISKLAENVGRLEREIEELDGLPHFVFFHTYEVHCPYLPREGTTDPDGIGMTKWLLDHDGSDLSPERLQQLQDLYRGEVAYTDSLLAPLVLRLLARGDWLVALVSDHGDEFGEHGGLLHADTLYEETTHVPFAVVGAGIPQAAVIPRRGSLVDVAPTLLALLGLKSPETWQGGDLRQEPESGATVFSESYYFGVHIPAQDPRVLGVWVGDHKLIQFQNFNRVSAELYDLASDPAEQRNFQASDVARRDGLFFLIENYLEEQGHRGGTLTGLTEEQIETMRSLGYIK